MPRAKGTTAMAVPHRLYLRLSILKRRMTEDKGRTVTYAEVLETLLERARAGEDEGED